MAAKISLDMNSVFGETPETPETRTSSAVPFVGVSVGESNLQQTDRQNTTVADVLLSVGLWPTRREMRAALASDLINAGFTATQVQKVADLILGMARDKSIALGELVNLLRDHKRLTESLEDLAKIRPSYRPHPGEADRERTAKRLEEERREWQDDDRLRYLRARKADGVAEHIAEAEWHARGGAR